MELDHVAVGDRMVPADMLSIESALAPHARVLDRPREVLVHELRDVFHRLTPAHGERPAEVRRTTRHLRVHAGEAEMVEEPGPDVAEALSGRRRRAPSVP